MNPLINTNLLIEQLCSQQFSIVDDFMPESTHQALCDLAREHHTNGNYETAKVGHNQSKLQIDAIRRDKIFWIENATSDQAIQAFNEAIQNLIQALNQALYLGLVDYEAHFAIYQPGDFYRKHIDQFKTTKTRQISCVYYLNQGWQEADGGTLQLYDQHNQAICTINPQGNRFVCFLSHLPHEVTLTNKTRYSLTGWLKTRAY